MIVTEVEELGRRAICLLDAIGCDETVKDGDGSFEAGDDDGEAHFKGLV